MNPTIKSSYICPHFVADKELRIVASNEMWKSIFFTGEKLGTLVGDQGQLNILQNFMSDPTIIHAFQIELSLKDKDQKLLNYSWTVIPSQDVFNFYGHSVGSHKTHESRYELMYHTTTDAVMLLGTENFTDCNQATLNIFKLKTVEDFVRCHPADLSPPFQPDGETSLSKANRMIEKAIKEGRNFFEWTHRDSEGHDFPCEVLLNRIEIDGKLYIQASVRDISDRIKMQQEVDETRISQVNAARLASLGEMAGGIAHEINNPMAIIRGQAEYLQRNLKNLAIEQREPLNKGLNKIVQTVDRITKIIKGLRSVSRDSSHDPMINQDLLEILNDTLVLFEEKFKLANIRNDLDSTDAQIFIACRPAEISQVVLNLLNNSYDAILGSENPWINISIAKHDGAVRLTLTDSGTIIPDKIADKIFEPFYTTKEVGKGTGLGLSISKSIVERHGGQFYLDRSAKNTTFQVVLPVSE